eukprot:tig00000754_g3908.t1
MRAQPLLVAESAARVQEEGARDAATPAVIRSCSLLCAGPGDTCPSARFPARRPAGCLSVVDSRLCAGPGATCPSARFPARRPAGCLSVVDSRLCAGPGATCPSARFPARELTPQLCVCAGYAQGPAPPAPPPASPPAAAFACLPA